MKIQSAEMDIMFVLAPAEQHAHHLETAIDF